MRHPCDSPRATNVRGLLRVFGYLSIAVSPPERMEGYSTGMVNTLVDTDPGNSALLLGTINNESPI